MRIGAALLAASALVFGGVSSTADRHASASASSVPHHTMVIGHSVRGRAIKATEIGKPNARHAVLVVGVIHGTEPAGLAILAQLARMRPPAGVDLWIVRLMNPDGYFAGTRQNAHGVDLNRNFPWKWQRSGHPGGLFYSGPSAASEPETRTAMRFIRSVRPQITIWYHQHEDEVIKAGHYRIDIERRYAQLVGLHFETHFPWAPGRATYWENNQVKPATAFVVELPAGSLSAADASRHARAVLAISKML